MPSVEVDVLEGLQTMRELSEAVERRRGVGEDDVGTGDQWTLVRPDS